MGLDLGLLGGLRMLLLNADRPRNRFPRTDSFLGRFVEFAPNRPSNILIRVFLRDSATTTVESRVKLLVLEFIDASITSRFHVRH